jgi:hypothetical protein
VIPSRSDFDESALKSGEGIMTHIRAALLAVFAAAALPAAAQTPPPATPGAADAAQVVSVIEHVCIPMIGGAKASTVAPALGMRTNRDGDLVMRLEGGKQITVTPPNGANPTLCTLTAVYDTGGDGAVYDALDGWSHARPVAYEQRRSKETAQAGDETHITSTWVGAEAAGTEGLVLIQAKRADGRPLSGRGDQATILFSITPN